MTNINEVNIERELQIVKTIYTQTQAVIDAMPTDGEERRMQINKMAEIVGVAIGKEPKDVLGFVNHYAHNAIGGYVTRGKKGGFIKGVKPLKTESVPVIKADSASSASE